MVVALTLTPALTLILLRNRRSSAGVPGRAGRCSGGYTRAAAPRDPPAALASTPASSPHRSSALARRADAGPVPVPALQGAGLPHPLGDPARDVGRRDAAHHDRRSARSCGRSPGCATSGAHRSGVPGRGDRRRQPRRELGQHRPVGRLRRDPVGHREVIRRVPGPVPRHADLPRRAHRGGRSPAARSPSWSASSAPIWTSSATRRRRSSTIMAGIHGRRRPARGHSSRRAAARGRGRPGRGGRSTASSPVTSGGPRRRCRRRGSRRHLPRRQGLRHRRLEFPEARDSVADIENLLIDTPTGRASGWGRGRRRASARPQLDRARGRLPAHRRRQPTSRAATSARSPRESSRSWPRSTSRVATTPSSSASTTSGRGPEPAAGHRRHRPGADPAPAAGLARQLAAALLVFLTLPFALVGGVLAAWLPRAASCPSDRSSASSPCSGSPPATGSC